MSANDIEALFEGSLADFEQHDGLAHIVYIYAVACAELFAVCDNIVKVAIALCFRHFDGLGNAFALGLAAVEECRITGADLVKLRKIGIGLGCPSIFTFHILNLRMIFVTPETHAHPAVDFIIMIAFFGRICKRLIILSDYIPISEQMRCA